MSILERRILGLKRSYNPNIEVIDVGKSIPEFMQPKIGKSIVTVDDARKTETNITDMQLDTFITEAGGTTPRWGLRQRLLHRLLGSNYFSPADRTS